MSYVKIYIPEIYQLKEQFDSDKDKWIQYYSKYEAFVGSSESVDYLTNEIEKYYENKKS